MITDVMIEVPPHPAQRPKLNLKPRSTPKEDDSSASTSQSSGAASIFGGAIPVDTAAREREVEERLQKEEEKLQRQLDEPKLERRPRERHPSWPSEETREPERAQTQSRNPPQVVGGKVAPAQPSEEGPTRKDDNKIDGMNVPKGQTGNSSGGLGDGGNKIGKRAKKDQDSRSAPEPKKPEENPTSKFSSA
ncbi:Hypothetical predicted protein, partial [Marmota monax]